MTQFIALNVDLSAQAAYVTYGVLPNGERARSKRISDDVAADYRENGELVGVELLALDASAFAQARAFAHDSGLAFPRDIPAAMEPA